MCNIMKSLLLFLAMNGGVGDGGRFYHTREIGILSLAKMEDGYLGFFWLVEGKLIFHFLLEADQVVLTPSSHNK